MFLWKGIGKPMNDYIKRIDDVITYINQHLGEKLTLEQLASISNFSKYHFSRVFSAVVGASPIAYIVNQRLQQAMVYLRETDKAIVEIALLCGFDNVSHFNTTFKKRFSMTPSDARKEAQRRDSNIPQYLRNILQEQWNPERYDEKEGNHFLRRIWSMNITITELPAQEVAYIRQVGSYLHTYHAWQKLGQWAYQRGLLPPGQTFIGVSLDDPSVVPEEECRYDACVTLPQHFDKQAEGEVQFKQLAGGLYGKYYFYDTLDKFAIAYSSLFAQWLPNSEYEPDDRDCLEYCLNDPSHDPEGKAKIELYIPIKKRV